MSSSRPSSYPPRPSPPSPTSDPRVALPGMLALGWMAFMQPVLLERRLQAAGVARPDLPLWQLFRQEKAAASAPRAYARRMLLLLALFTGGIGVTSGLALANFDLTLGRAGQILGAAWVLGLLSIVSFKHLRRRRRALFVGLATGTVGVLLFSALVHDGLFDPGDLGAAQLAIGLLFAVLAGLAARFALTTLTLATFGASSLIPHRLFNSMEKHRRNVGVLVSSRLVVALVLGAGLGSLLDDRSFLSPSSAFISLVLVVILLPRLVLFPFEAALSGLLYAMEHFRGVPSLGRSPVLFHELSYLPYPWLERHMMKAAERDPKLVERVIDACAVAPGQRAIGRSALARLQARALEDLARKGAFKAVRDLSDRHFLPGSPKNAPRQLVRFAELGRVLTEAQASTPHVAIRHLEHADRMLRAIEQDLVSDDSPLGRALRLTHGTWADVLARLMPKAKREAEHTLQNPFRMKALDPLRGDAEVFRGREALVRELRSTLIDGEQGSTIALLGPRRCGKTSFLKLLPTFLPNTTCVYFDPQHNPVASPASFFSALSQRTAEATFGRASVPTLPPDASFDEGAAWFRSLETALGDRRVLICIDEVERFEELYADHPRDVERLLGLLRATMQHGSQVRLLLSAKAPFERNGRLWNDHFINAHEMWLDHLGERDGIALLTRPTREFPSEAIPAAVAREIFERTGGQPFLLQAYGSNLVNKLNHERRMRARKSDVEQVEARVLELHRTYFANVLDDSPPDVRRALADLAENKPVRLDARTRRELRNRRLVTSDDRLRIPVLGTWIREEWQD
jgi:hypothetical protein